MKKEGYVRRARDGRREKRAIIKYGERPQNQREAIRDFIGGIKVRFDRSPSAVLQEARDRRQ